MPTTPTPFTVAQSRKRRAKRSAVVRCVQCQIRQILPHWSASLALYRQTGRYLCVVCEQRGGSAA